MVDHEAPRDARHDVIDHQRLIHDLYRKSEFGVVQEEAGLLHEEVVLWDKTLLFYHTGKVFFVCEREREIDRQTDRKKGEGGIQI